MKSCLLITSVLLIWVQYIYAQQLNYTSEVLAGHRSVAFQHKVNHTFNEDFKLLNIFNYETEYGSDKNNLYFLRSSLYYEIHKRFGMNLGIGLKNPGAFATVSGRYQYNLPSFLFLYEIGATYQDHFTLEQFTLVEYTPLLKDDVYLLIKVQLTSNRHRALEERGIQQARLGIKQDRKQFGLAANCDQFNNRTKTLKNYGLFYKYEF